MEQRYGVYVPRLCPLNFNYDSPFHSLQKDQNSATLKKIVTYTNNIHVHVPLSPQQSLMIPALLPEVNSGFSLSPFPIHFPCRTTGAFRPG